MEVYLIMHRYIWDSTHCYRQFHLLPVYNSEKNVCTCWDPLCSWPWGNNQAYTWLFSLECTSPDDLSAVMATPMYSALEVFQSLRPAINSFNNTSIRFSKHCAVANFICSISCNLRIPCDTNSDIGAIFTLYEEMKLRGATSLPWVLQLACATARKRVTLAPSSHSVS